ncbi:APC family permease [Ferruginibacter albus]|uniref:APC family permease n=1 Tax=Ferruginibacter albus TaxID=2875540 RepID=UPI001CC7FB84|nr:APC family permease [Ferruginibacter albus]UAY52004.1 APC family permease [Ferruginibacter albus]
MRPVPTSISKKLKPIHLAAIIFLTVSGGPYGIEPLLYFAGNHAALLLLILVPLLWDIPTIFTVLELNSMMPVNGGYYQWVKRAMGKRFALYEGWWTWLYTFVDLAIYPVLFVEYAAFFFPQLAAYKIPVCLVIIWLCAAINILGIMPVGKISIVLTAIVLIPFLIFFVLAFSQHHDFSIPHLSLHGVGFSSIGMGLYTVMWNFLGWDNTTTYAEEVDKPVKSYLTSVGIAFGLVFLIYFVTIVAAQASGIDYATLKEEGFPALGRLIGGKWLGVILAIGGMASTLGLFSAVLLSVSRVPKVMADDKLLTEKLSALHPRFNTPYISIIVCAVVVSIMIFWSFEELVVIDVTLYGAALSLEFVSLIVLRVKAPNEHRPFKIPLNVTGLCLMILLPLCVYAIALTAALKKLGTHPALFAIAILFTAEIVWQIIVWRNPQVATANS